LVLKLLHKPRDHTKIEAWERILVTRFQDVWQCSFLLNIFVDLVTLKQFMCSYTDSKMKPF
jgi:hypothetical protein